MRYATVAFALLGVVGGPSLALAQGGPDACNGPDLKASISACGRLIDNTALPTSLRVSAYRNRAIRLLAQGRLDDALADLNEDLRLAPEDAIGLTFRATVYMKLGKAGNAGSDLDEALKLKPDLPQALVAKGLLEYQSGDLDAAIADSTKAIGLDSRLTAAYNNRGAALRDKGEYQRAIADFNVVVRMSPAQARPLFNRGLAYQRAGNRAQALKDFEAALVLSPDDPDALAGRASIGSPVGQAPKAAEGTVRSTRSIDRRKSSGEMQFIEAKRTLKALLEKGRTKVFDAVEDQQLTNAWFIYISELRIPHFSNEPSTEVQHDPQLEDDYRSVLQIQQNFAIEAKERSEKEAIADQRYFEANVPQACQSFTKTEAFEAEEKKDGSFIKMAGLFQAGDNEDACLLQGKIYRNVEDARSEMITCYRAAEALSERSKKMGQLGEGVMAQASQMNDLKTKLEQLGHQYNCQ